MPWNLLVEGELSTNNWVYSPVVNYGRWFKIVCAYSNPLVWGQTGQFQEETAGNFELFQLTRWRIKGMTEILEFPYATWFPNRKIGLQISAREELLGIPFQLYVLSGEDSDLSLEKIQMEISLKDIIISGISAIDVNAIPLSEKGVPGGVASLGQNGIVLLSQLPTPSSSGSGGLTESQVISLIGNFLEPRQKKSWSQGIVKNGNVLVAVGNASNYFWSAFKQNPGSFSDRVEVDFYLPAGNYQVIVRGNKSLECGRQQIRFMNPDSGDPQIRAEIDWYNSTPQFNELAYFDFSTTTVGKKTLSFEVVGKNAASTGYFIEIVEITVSRN